MALCHTVIVVAVQTLFTEKCISPFPAQFVAVASFDCQWVLWLLSPHVQCPSSQNQVEWYLYQIKSCLMSDVPCNHILTLQIYQISSPVGNRAPALDARERRGWLDAALQCSISRVDRRQLCSAGSTVFTIKLLRRSCVRYTGTGAGSLFRAEKF